MPSFAAILIKPSKIISSLWRCGVVLQNGFSIKGSFTWDLVNFAVMEGSGYCLSTSAAWIKL
jgi:hypothetical protein